MHRDAGRQIDKQKKKQDADKCAANAIHILLFVVNHTILLAAKKKKNASVNVTKNLCTILNETNIFYFLLKSISNLLLFSSQLPAWQILLKID